jgi:putative glycosyltransferase
MAALYLIIRRIFLGVMLQGWASLIVSIWLLGGITIFCLGIIAIYLSKVFIEVKQRPYTIIREVYETKKLPSALSDRELTGAHFEQRQQQKADERR